MPIVPNQSEVVYKPVVGFPGFRVGDDGSLWSCWKKIQNGTGYGCGFKSVMTTDWHRIHGGHDEDGYVIVFVGSTTTNNKRRRQLHRLVLEAFVGPCPPSLQARHLDGNPRNNKLSNLAWGSCLENNHDKWRHGTMMRGENHGNHRYTEKQILEVMRLLKQKKTYRWITEKTGVSKKTAQRVKFGDAWKHLKLEDDETDRT